MYKVILLLGGNLGNVKDTLNVAKDTIASEIGVINETSALYASEPWGFEHAQHFINQVIEINTSLSPEELLSTTQKIEKKLGRKQKTSTHYEGRLIDIDILFIDDIIINKVDLIVPHPRLHERLFTLLPLNEKWAHLIHPLLNKSIKDIKDLCKDKCWVKVLD